MVLKPTSYNPLKHSISCGETRKNKSYTRKGTMFQLLYILMLINHLKIGKIMSKIESHYYILSKIIYLLVKNNAV